MTAMIPSKPSMSASFPPTRGAFSTCTEMCGNGSMTGRRTILPVPRPILRVRHRARSRVGRGGSWGNIRGPYLRSAKICFNTPVTAPVCIGFRVAFQAIQPDTANPEIILKQDLQPKLTPKVCPSSTPALRPTMHGTEISPIRSWSRDRWI